MDPSSSSAVPSPAQPDADLDTRRRRAVYRASHRGTKEMDLLLGRYAEAVLPGLDATALTRFEQFLAIPDPELQGWLLAPQMLAGGEMADLVLAIRRFHHLE